MNIINDIAVWAVYFWMRLGIQRYWSIIYAFIWERKMQEPLQRFAGIGELASFIRTLKWRPDTWRELGDAISSIGAIMWKALHAPERAIGDCDEFGRLIAAIIRNELRSNPRWGTGDIETTYLLSVMWKKIGGKEWEGNAKGFGGHNVCLIRYTDGYWAYMDYGMPSKPRQDVWDVVRDVRDAYAQEYLPMGYAWQDPDTLKIVGISRE